MLPFHATVLRCTRGSLVLLCVPVFVGCAERLPTDADQSAVVGMNAITPATVRTLVVNISGPGISPNVIVNIPVGADSVARGTLVVPAGSARRFVITAVDTAGVDTHRGDTTITLVPGTNPPLAITMRPLSSSLGVTVTFGNPSALALGLAFTTIVEDATILRRRNREPK